MSRRVTGAAAVMFATLLVSVAPASRVAWASAQPVAPTSTSVPPFRSVDVQVSRNSRGVLHALDGGASQQIEQAGNAAAPDTLRTGARDHAYYVSFPKLHTQPDGTRCIHVMRRAFSTAAAAAVAEDAQDALWRISSRDYPLCERAVVADTTPAAEAAMFWRVVGEDLLPRPSPRIAPGYMLAGKLAYLEAGTESTARFDHDTPLGTLTIEATAKVFVDWGDGGRLDGPHDGPGGPWPKGDITHFWTTAGTYDIRVVQRWTARWRLGDDHSGELVGLSTEAVIHDFEVRQLQAVRNN